MDNNHKEANVSFIKELYSYYGYQYKSTIASAIILSILTPLLSLVPIYLLGIIIDGVLLNQAQFKLPLIPLTAMPDRSLYQLVFGVSIMLAAALLSSLAQGFGQMLWTNIAHSVQYKMRMDAFEDIEKAKLDYFQNKQTGEIMSILNNDVTNIGRFLRRVADAMLNIFFTFAGVIGVMFYLHWQLAIIALIILPIQITISYYFIQFVHPFFENIRDSIGQLNSQLENTISGIRTIKAYTGEEYEVDRTSKEARKVRNSTIKAYVTAFFYHPTLSFINWIGFGVVLLVGGHAVFAPSQSWLTVPTTIGTLVALVTYTQRLTEPIMQSGHMLRLYQDAAASLRRIFALFNRPKEAIDNTIINKQVDNISGKISYKNINFSYDDEDVLENINFDVPAKASIGIVGETGSGKSTLVKLLLRFHDPESGSITLDGRNLTEYDLSYLRNEIGYVGQEPFLFYGTIYDNLVYPNRDIAEDKIRQVAQKCGVKRFVHDLPNNYQTEVGERGIKLSGGQRQRIALARAILSDPTILILDEATSHVDNETEQFIQNNIQSLLDDYTVFSIAHRLSTIRDADNIFVLNNNTISESGTHNELIKNNGLYNKLWSIQTGKK